MSREYFWGCELNKTNSEYLWQPEKDLDTSTTNEDVECLSHALILKQAFLGGSDETVDSEVNIVELETEGYLATEVKQPIFRLKDGVCDQCTLDLYIPKTATLRLISGSGPVHICGQHIVEYVNDEDIEEDSDYTSADPKGKDSVDVTKSDLVNEIGKRKSENGKSNPKKMARMDYNSSSEGEDDDDDDEEDDDDNGVVEVIASPSPVKNLRKKPVARAKAKNEQVAKRSKK